MSLASQLAALNTLIAQTIKANKILLNNNAADLSALTTTVKTNLLAALNEVNAKQIPFKTVTELGSITPQTGVVCLCVNEISSIGIGCLVVGDGTNWRRAVDGGILGSYAKRYPSTIDFYPFDQNSTINAGTQAANTLKGFLWFPKESVVITQVILEITTAVAAANLRFGLYLGNGRTPLTLIPNSDGGNITAATTGDKTIVFSSPITIPLAPIWIVINSSISTIAARVAAIGSAPSISPVAGTSANNTISVASSPFGAMPTIFPTSGLTFSSSTLILPRFRAQ
jgi:hypothetical protein